MGGFSIIAQDYPLGPTVSVFTTTKIAEGEFIYLSPVQKIDGTIFYRVMSPDEIELEVAEYAK
jgi:hypothetical protein